jgi:hypothetical protein
MGRVAASAWGPGGIGRFSPKKDNPTAGQTAAHALPALYPRRTRQRPPQTHREALERITLDPGRIGAITTAALVLLQLQKPKRAGLKDKADVVRSSLEAFVVKLVPIEQVSPSRTGPGRLAYIQAAPDYGVGMESW